MLRAMPAPMFPSPMNPTRMARLLLGEDFLEEDGGARGRIGADQLFLLAHHVEESVEGLTRDVVVEIEALGFRDLQGLFEAGAGLAVGDAAARDALEELIDLGGGGRGEEHQADEQEQQVSAHETSDVGAIRLLDARGRGAVASDHRAVHRPRRGAASRLDPRPRLTPGTPSGEGGEPCPPRCASIWPIRSSCRSFPESGRGKPRRSSSFAPSMVPSVTSTSSRRFSAPGLPRRRSPSSPISLPQTALRPKRPAPSLVTRS